MTSSYEARIIEAMLRRAEAMERGDAVNATYALIEATEAAADLRSKRREVTREERARRDTAGELEVVKP